MKKATLDFGKLDPDVRGSKGVPDFSDFLTKKPGTIPVVFRKKKDAPQPAPKVPVAKKTIEDLIEDAKTMEFSVRVENIPGANPNLITALREMAISKARNDYRYHVLKEAFLETLRQQDQSNPVMIGTVEARMNEAYKRWEEVFSPMGKYHVGPLDRAETEEEEIARQDMLLEELKDLLGFMQITQMMAEMSVSLGKGMPTASQVAEQFVESTATFMMAEILQSAENDLGAVPDLYTFTPKLVPDGDSDYIPLGVTPQQAAQSNAKLETYLSQGAQDSRIGWMFYAQAAAVSGAAAYAAGSHFLRFPGCAEKVWRNPVAVKFAAQQPPENDDEPDETPDPVAVETQIRLSREQYEQLPESLQDEIDMVTDAFKGDRPDDDDDVSNYKSKLADKLREKAKDALKVGMSPRRAIAIAATTLSSLYAMYYGWKKSVDLYNKGFSDTEVVRIFTSTKSFVEGLEETAIKAQIAANGIAGDLDEKVLSEIKDLIQEVRIPTTEERYKNIDDVVMYASTRAALQLAVEKENMMDIEPSEFAPSSAQQVEYLNNILNGLENSRVADENGEAFVPISRAIPSWVTSYTQQSVYLAQERAKAIIQFDQEEVSAQLEGRLLALYQNVVNISNSTKAMADGPLNELVKGLAEVHTKRIDEMGTVVREQAEVLRAGWGPLNVFLKSLDNFGDWMGSFLPKWTQPIKEFMGPVASVFSAQVMQGFLAFDRLFMKLMSADIFRKTWAAARSGDKEAMASMGAKMGGFITASYMAMWSATTAITMVASGLKVGASLFRGLENAAKRFNEWIVGVPVPDNPVVEKPTFRTTDDPWDEDFNVILSKEAYSQVKAELQLLEEDRIALKEWIAIYERTPLQFAERGLDIDVIEEALAETERKLYLGEKREKQFEEWEANATKEMIHEWEVGIIDSEVHRERLFKYANDLANVALRDKRLKNLGHWSGLFFLGKGVAAGAHYTSALLDVIGTGGMIAAYVANVVVVAITMSTMIVAWLPWIAALIVVGTGVAASGVILHQLIIQATGTYSPVRIDAGAVKWISRCLGGSLSQAISYGMATGKLWDQAAFLYSHKQVVQMGLAIMSGGIQNFVPWGGNARVAPPPSPDAF